MTNVNGACLNPIRPNRQEQGVDVPEGNAVEGQQGIVDENSAEDVVCG